MAELLIRPLISMVMKKASSYLLDQYRVMEGMEEQHRIMERYLPAILDIIQDAEEKGASRPGVRAWLEDLKIVSYEANNVFDEFQYEALRREAWKKGQRNTKALTSFPARNPIVFRYRMGMKLQKIVQAIEVLVNDMNKFGFRNLQEAPPSKHWRKTDSIIVDSDNDIISRSRDEEKKKIMSILLNEASSKELTVLPIVGMGGMGKTTFVQLIYNDAVIEKNFELRRWCCVSDDFDAANIASSICQTNANDNREKALQDLRSLISGKRYLIVLDDVWDPNDDKWGKLRSCLKNGGKGSVVLTTTRNAEIARRMAIGVAEAYNIEKLSHKHLKEIVESRAFSSQKPNDHKKLDRIVDEVVDRCYGSPLAAKAFGSMLSTKTTMNEWKDTLAKSNICNERTDILPVLKLSFDDLPSHMKQCFAFCAIFPKDYIINVDILIQLWMAHDLIPLQEDEHLETTGAEIFKELTWRSFFQDIEQRRPNKLPWGSFFQDVEQRNPDKYARLQFCKKSTCKIHDLMHDIALSVMGKECVTIVDNSSMKKFLAGPSRHAFLKILGRVERKVLDEFLDKPTLQTLLCEDSKSSFVILECTSLRALHLPGFIKLGGMALKHLRYLNLSGNLYLNELPEDISCMYNLQTLDLSNCENLRQLPKNMKYITSLRHLYTTGCESLTCMPPGLGRITCLQTITYFIVGASSRCSNIGELQNLDLGGELELSCLENTTETFAKEVNLSGKEKLTHLSLQWNNEDCKKQVQDCHKKVLHALQPHAGLEMLRIINYKGTSLPSWVSYLSLLTELHLLGCVLCEEFPQFCHLKSLQVLYLKGLDKLRSLCSVTSSMVFLALKELRLHDLESLERWVSRKGNTALFPVLEKIDIKNCPMLTTLPKASNLKVIKLDERNALLSSELFVKSRHYMSSLSMLELSIHDTEKSISLQIDRGHELSSLSELCLKGCYFFSSNNSSKPTFGAWKRFEKLVSLEISYCDSLIYWPEDVFQSLVWLKKMEISYCRGLIGRIVVRDGKPKETTDQILPHLNSLHICECESLKELFILPSSITLMFIKDCPKLESVWGQEKHHETNDVIQPEYCRDLASANIPEQSTSPTNPSPCIKTLYIWQCRNLAILPNLPPSLKYVSIFECEKLRFVSGHLDALEELHIWDCSKLQSLDCSGDLSSLQVLFLERCQCLASLPGVLWNYSALRELRVRYCPAIDLNPLYRQQRQRLNSLEYKDISFAHSSYPPEGLKLGEPRSWKYAIPGVAAWTSRRHWR